MKTMHKCLLATALAGIASVAVAAVKFSTFYPTNFSFTTPTALVPLNSAGATTVTWSETGAVKRILTFSAECAVRAPEGITNAWVDLDVTVNGAVVAPTLGTADSFCSANGTEAFDGWIRPSISLPITTKNGSNTVSVVARLSVGATGGWVSDSALVIN